MNNLIAQRFSKPSQGVVQPHIQIHNSQPPAPTPTPTAPAVSPDELRTKLTEAVTPKITDEPTGGLALVHFANVLEFCHWYDVQRSRFSESQQKALDSLLEARNLLTASCNCDRTVRENIVADYFRKFWMFNQSTDLLPTLQKILNTKKIVFGDFLVYPT